MHPRWNCVIIYRVIDDETLAQMNGKQVCPLDAGPAWRAALEAGIDMSLVEDSLKLTPEERLAEHQQVIAFLLEVQEAGPSRFVTALEYSPGATLATAVRASNAVDSKNGGQGEK